MYALFYIKFLCIWAEFPCEKWSIKTTHSSAMQISITDTILPQNPAEPLSLSRLRGERNIGRAAHAKENGSMPWIMPRKRRLHLRRQWLLRRFLESLAINSLSTNNNWGDDHYHRGQKRLHKYFWNRHIDESSLGVRCSSFMPGSCPGLFWRSEKSVLLWVRVFIYSHTCHFDFWAILVNSMYTNIEIIQINRHKKKRTI